jgi:hypothetical protein
MQNSGHIINNARAIFGQVSSCVSVSAVHKAKGNLFIKQQKNQNLPQGRIFFVFHKMRKLLEREIISNQGLVKSGCEAVGLHLSLVV